MKKLYVLGMILGIAACSPKNLSVKWKDTGLLSGQVFTSSGSSSVVGQSLDGSPYMASSQSSKSLNNASFSQKPVFTLDSCTNPTVSLFEVGDDGQKTGSAIGTSVVENDGTYKIKLPFRKLPSEKTYIVEVSGCTENLSRVVTEQSQQDISVGTSLLSSWLPNSNVADRIVTADKSVFKSLLSAVRDSDSYTLAYSTILNNSVLNADFQRVFGVSPTTLRNVAPEKTDLVAPQVMTEGAATTLSMVVKHWSPEYQFAYKWMVDDVVIGTTANVSFIPHANMQGAHTLKVFYGAKNIAGELDLTKPYKQKSIAINILNAQPALVPAVSLTSGSLASSPTLHIALDTGALRSNCQSFSRLAIKEDVPTSPLLESEFQYTCDTAGTQDLVYTLLGVDGPHTLYVWTQDAAGNISATPRTLSVTLDTTNPILTVGAPASGARVKGSFTLSGTCEPGTNVAIGGADVISQSATCNAGVFSTLATLNAGESLKSLTIAQTDLAGNSSSVNLSVLRDDTTPAPSITSPVANSSYQNNLILSGSCSQNTGDNQTVSISSAGITGSPLSTSCSSGNYSQSVTLIGAEGLKTLVVSQLDEAGNVGSTSLGVLKDTTAPVINLVGPAVNFRSQSGIVLSGTCEDGTISISGDTSPTTTTCSGGSFSQAITLNGADGSKSITLTQTDAAGNIGTSSRTFLKDTSAPDLNITSPSANERFQTTVITSGTCEPGGDLDFTGADITPISNVTCPGSGNFSQSIVLSGVDGVKTFTVDHRDSLNNVTSSTVNVVKDNVAPSLALSSPAALTDSQSTLTLNGTCGTATGDQSTVTLESTAVDGAPLTTACSSGAFSQLITLSGSDGTKSVTIKQKDSANNESIQTRSFIKDTTSPVLAISSPNSLSSFQNTLTLTGTCETGLTVNISGDATATTTACSGSSFSTSITLSATDGAKLITVSQTDTAGNTGSAFRTFYRDTTAPAITFSSPIAGTNIQSMVAISGTCEAGLTIAYSGDISSPSSTSCASGSFSDTVTLTAGQGSKTLTLSQTDSAGNIGSQSLSVTRDNTAPLITFTSPTANSSYQNSVTVSGTCGTLATDLSSLTLTGPFTGSPIALNCISGIFNSTVSLTGADGLKTLAISQQDQAANSSTANLNLYRDTTAPLLTITSPAANFVTQGSVTLTGSCETSAAINLSGDASLAPFTCLGGNFSVNLSLSGTDGARSISIAHTDNSGNTSNVSRSFVKDTTAPILNSVIVNNGDVYAGTPFLSVVINSSDLAQKQVRVAEAVAGNCQSAYADNNWTPLTTSNTFNTNILVGTTDGIKKICAWSKDEAGNVSIQSPVAGIDGVTTDSINFQIGNLPQVVNLQASNATAGANFGTTTFAAGNMVNINYSISDVEGLDNNPITLEYTTNGGTWIPIVSNYGGFSNYPTSITSSYSSFTAPGSAPFRIRMTLKDSSGNLSTPVSTDWMNSTGWSVYAGSYAATTYGGSPLSFTPQASIGSMNRFAIHPLTGDFYIIDSGVGLAKVDAKTGAVTKVLTHGTSSSALNGTLTATSGFNSTTANILFDKLGNLYLKHLDTYAAGGKLWKINLSNMSYVQVLGGGNVYDHTATPSTVYIMNGGIAFDEQENFYFLSSCNPGTWSTVTPGALRVMKAQRNPDSSFGSISVVAGNCTLGVLPGNGPYDPLTQPVFNTAYPELTSIVAFNNGSAVYFFTNSGNRTFKVLNGQIYRSNLTHPGMMYNSLENRMYVTNSTLSSCTLNLSGANGESCSAYVATNGTGGCLEEGVDRLSACSNVTHNPVLSESGTLFFVEGTTVGNFRIRYVDSSNKLRTLIGSKSFGGDGLDKAVIRAQIKGIYYKKASESNQGAFPEGLYFVEPTGPTFNYIHPVTGVTSTLWGNQSMIGVAADGTLMDKTVTMGHRYTGGDGYSLAFDSNGLPWLRYGFRIAMVDSSKRIQNKATGTHSWVWHQAAQGADPRNFGAYVFGGYQNLALKNNGVFFIGGFYSAGDPGYNTTTSSIKLFDFDSNVVTHILGNGSNGAVADVTTPGQVTAASLPSSCLNSGKCTIQYRADQDRLYFLQDLAIRYISTPSTTATSTLTTLLTLPTTTPSTPVENFTFRPDGSQIFYLRAGKIHCQDISSGKSWCNNTPLGPHAPLNTIAFSPNQFTWKDNQTLFISTGYAEVYKYDLQP